MTLNKRYKRNIKSNLSFYISIILLTAISIMLYRIMACGLTGEESYINDYKKDCVAEDAQFTLYSALTDDDIQNLEDQYDLILEQQKYIDADSGKSTIRIFHNPAKIDKTLVTYGHKIRNDDEILLSKSYMDANNLENGDRIKINNKKYTICGSFVRPDYLYVLSEINGSYATPETFGIAIVSTEEYENIYNNLKDDETVYYTVKYNKDNEISFRKALNDSYMVSNYVSSSNNTRITTADNTLDQIRMFKDEMIPMMFLFIVLIIAVIFSRKIKSEQKMIGILSALGYSKNKLALHYSLFGVFAALAGSIAGLIAAVPLEKSFIPLMFSKIESLPVEYGFESESLVVSILVPLIIYTAAVFITARCIMRKDVISMITGNDNKEKKTRFRMAASKLKFSTKYKIRAVFGNYMRTMVVIIGICIGSIIFLWTYCIIDSLGIYVNDSIDKIGNMHYEYFFNTLKEGTVEEGVPVLCTNFECDGFDTSVGMMGMENNDLLRTDLQNGKEADLSSGSYYITSMGANIYGVEKGDKITLRNISSLEKKEIRISGIIDNDSQNMIYTSRSNVSEIMGISDDTYNLVVSDKKLDFNKNELSQTISKHSLKEQIQNVYDMMKSMIGIMIPFGILICILVIYIMVNMIITENESSISMLKVLGYRNKEINRIITNVYHYIMPIAILLGLAAGYMVTKYYFISNTAAFSTYIEAHLSVATVVKYLVLVIASYFASLYILGRKVNKVNMTESLKDNRE